MTTPVNLNRFKKAKARAEKSARAEENSVKFGRSKADKSLDKAKAELAERSLSGKKRDP
ncbi:DUF4169 family protein [Lentibacter algarum]|uniref:DUF4169 family protein n=1 Tax=Lentibacter algarum TaxID=576131 RepID=UPI001C066975|nr:DUF4169 family protein [Lentibacter algarum]MBU2982232.1 DUF4169 family protein [Lentibacter algarum]